MYQITLENSKANGNSANKSGNIVGAVGGITGGLIMMLSGIILSVISFINNESFHGIEVILLSAAFGLLFVGSHFLDRIENEKKSIRAAFDEHNKIETEKYR